VFSITTGSVIPVPCDSAALVLIVAEPSARLLVAVVFSILVAISCAAYILFWVLSWRFQ
jgi:hypothetical protein